MQAAAPSSRRTKSAEVKAPVSSRSHVPTTKAPAGGAGGGPAPLAALVGKGQRRELVGRTLGEKYRVRSVLGEGGMGTVYEAEHIAIGRAVAIKVLHPAQARKREAVKRFHHEARAAGAIGHPNICEVYDFGTLDDGSPYLVMERLVGETLADRIAADGGLPFDDVIDIVVQMLSGLVAAHEKNVVHRDIKPENVFLTKRVGLAPVAKLLDFGVSKMITPRLGGERDEDLDLTRTGMVMGTPYYMSPEQARGERNLDARVDLWACGVLLYESLTGRRPFQAANYNALLLQILQTAPRPARDLRPALPAGFDAILDKALAKDRAQRYLTAGDFQRDLQGLRDRPASARRPAVPDAARPMVRVSKPAPSAPPPPPPARERPSAPGSRPSAPGPRPSAPGSRPEMTRPRIRKIERRAATKPVPVPVPVPARATVTKGRTPAAGRPRRAPSAEIPSAPSSLQIPVTFAADTPMAGEFIPAMSAPALPGDEYVDNDATQVGGPSFLREGGDAEITQKGGPEFDADLAAAQKRLDPTDADDNEDTEVMHVHMLKKVPRRR